MTHPWPEVSSMQHTATHCNTLDTHTYQFVSALCTRDMCTHFNTLQHIATHYNTLHHTATHQIHTRTHLSKHFVLGICVHTATHCNTLQYTATHYSTLQHTATQHTATPYSTLQHTATHCNTPDTRTYPFVSAPCTRDMCTHCNALQRTATHCSTLQHAATLCNTLQHTTARCNTLQHTRYTHVPICLSTSYTGVVTARFSV